jgi:hypothetical protein
MEDPQELDILWNPSLPSMDDFFWGSSHDLGKKSPEMGKSVN